ncbi:MAG: hypothetical protein LQ352_003646 [Teloschistes flavicans]|nr:MAG: hypothetical protein LQ352_003646 [Teloschistes flavicans]
MSHPHRVANHPRDRNTSPGRSEDTGNPPNPSDEIPRSTSGHARWVQAHESSHNSPTFTFSVERGDLYRRRAQRRTSQIPTVPPPPPQWDSPGYRHSSGPSSPEVLFNPGGIFNRLLEYPELVFETIRHLSIPDLISLYAISKDFHALADSHFTPMILDHARVLAPEAARIFPFRCYRSLCIRDPAQRRNEAKAHFEVRFVPSFRWLQMIIFREGVVEDIVACLEEESLMLPAATTLTIKKMWFTIDIPTNRQRGQLMHNPAFWTEQDLYLATLFVMKLDMLLTCPFTGEGDLGLRRMLLGQRSLSTLAAVMKREEMRNEYEMLQMILRFDHAMDDAQRALRLPMFGVPFDQIGKLQYEGWGANEGVLFQQIDDLLMLECARRGLDMPAYYLDMVFYGFVDKKVGLDIWTEAQKRRMREDEERAAAPERDGSHEPVIEEMDGAHDGHRGDVPVDGEATGT